MKTKSSTCWKELLEKLKELDYILEDEGYQRFSGARVTVADAIATLNEFPSVIRCACHNVEKTAVVPYREALKALMDANPNDSTWNYQAAWDNAYKLLHGDKQ
jgi:hypothetical protein